MSWNIQLIRLSNICFARVTKLPTIMSESLENQQATLRGEEVQDLDQVLTIRSRCLDWTVGRCEQLFLLPFFGGERPQSSKLETLWRFFFFSLLPPPLPPPHPSSPPTKQKQNQTLRDVRQLAGSNSWPRGRWLIDMTRRDFRWVSDLMRLGHSSATRVFFIYLFLHWRVARDQQAIDHWDRQVFVGSIRSETGARWSLLVTIDRV